VAGAPAERPPPFCLVSPGHALCAHRHKPETDHMSADVLSRLDELEAIAASNGMVFGLWPGSHDSQCSATYCLA
jgi:hypothetical protein